MGVGRRWGFLSLPRVVFLTLHVKTLFPDCELKTSMSTLTKFTTNECGF